MLFRNSTTVETQNTWVSFQVYIELETRDTSKKVQDFECLELNSSKFCVSLIFSLLISMRTFMSHNNADGSMETAKLS